LTNANVPMRYFNPVETAFYEIDIAMNILGRTAKGRPDMVDPERALREAKRAEDALKVFKAVCREDIIARRQAKAKKVLDDKIMATQRETMELERAAQNARRVVAHQTVVEGLVIMSEMSRVVEFEPIKNNGFSRMLQLKRKTT